jgi:murein DD-endopeptidase MepM/ murein hydrolase activator NlpD
MSSPFGYRSDPFHGYAKRHTGVDFAMKPGNRLYATGDGVVSVVKFELFGYGNQVTIDHGFGYKTRYAHMKTINVVEGMKVKRGQIIGYMGNSGVSTGAHVHYEVKKNGKPGNPISYIAIDITPNEYDEIMKVNNRKVMSMD